MSKVVVTIPRDSAIREIAYRLARAQRPVGDATWNLHAASDEIQKSLATKTLAELQYIYNDVLLPPGASCTYEILGAGYEPPFTVKVQCPRSRCPK